MGLVITVLGGLGRRVRRRRGASSAHAWASWTFPSQPDALRLPFSLLEGDDPIREVHPEPRGQTPYRLRLELVALLCRQVVKEEGPELVIFLASGPVVSSRRPLSDKDDWTRQEYQEHVSRGPCVHCRQSLLLSKYPSRRTDVVI